MMLTEYWKIPKMWKDGEAWIIGGGLSMPRQFGVSEDVIYDVTSEMEPMTVYSNYMKEIHNRNVIGVNVAFLLGSWISVLYFCDPVFFRTYMDDILEFKNIKATCANHIARRVLPQARNIKRLKRDMRPGLSRQSNTICWNNNSGGAAIDFAAHAGVKRILLLGFDMKYVDKKAHWHAGFSTYKNPANPASFRKFLRSFPAVAEAAKRRKIEILNVSSVSAIKEFPKVELKEVL